MADRKMFLLTCEDERFWYVGPSAEEVLAFHRRQYDGEDDELGITEMAPTDNLTCTDVDEGTPITMTCAEWIAGEDFLGRRVAEIASTING